MKMIGSKIETLFHEKILLYRDLLECLKQEAESITAINVEALWKISDKKQRIASKIEGVRGMILDQMAEASIHHDMDTTTFQTAKILSLLPKEIREPLGMAQLTLVALKNDIQNRLDENKRFLGEYLAVLDELIGIITDAGNPEPIYKKRPCPEKSTANLILHREV
jgi:hypothetical protein